MWTCPSCQQPLSLLERQYRCDNNHSYDLAKEGYVNLLLAHQKRSKDPGDNKDMINARRQFLEAGHYAPLAEAISQLIQRHIDGPSVRLFDAGCGEGYYLNSVTGSLVDAALEVTASGCDVSKIAILKAAKRYPSASFAVASTFNLPLDDEQLDAIIQVFAPSAEAEIARVLSAQGVWVTANPAPEHLRELKSLVYQQQQQHEEKSALQPGFSLVEQQRLTFSFELADPQERMALLKMTPYYWSADEQSRQRIVEELSTVTADFQLNVYCKEQSDD